jgi:hypothetical protein
MDQTKRLHQPPALCAEPHSEAQALPPQRCNACQKTNHDVSITLTNKALLIAYSVNFPNQQQKAASYVRRSPANVPGQKQSTRFISHPGVCLVVMKKRP